MKKVRFTEHQIINALKSVEKGRTVKGICREFGYLLMTWFKEVLIPELPKNSVIINR